MKRIHSHQGLPHDNADVRCSRCRNEMVACVGSVLENARGGDEALDHRGLPWLWWMCVECGSSTAALPIPRGGVGV